MASKKHMDLLNAAATREILVAIQYIWQHLMVRGIEAESSSSSQGGAQSQPYQANRPLQSPAITLLRS